MQETKTNVSAMLCSIRF